MSTSDPKQPNGKLPLFERPVVVNVGLDLFAEAIVDQGGKCVQVDWSPPATNDEETLNLLDELL